MGLRVGAFGLEFRVRGEGLQGEREKGRGLGCRVRGLGFTVSGFRVAGFY